MPATITSQFRKNNAKNLIANASAIGQSYWIGIGKSDEWPAVPNSIADIDIPYPNSSIDYSAVTLENLISLRKSVGAGFAATAPSLMITANVWAAGRKYKIYDSGNDECFIPKANDANTAVELYPCHTSVVSGNKEYFFLCVGVFKTLTYAHPVTTVGSDPLTQFNMPSSDGGYNTGYIDTVAAVAKMVNTAHNGAAYRWVYIYSLNVNDTFNMIHFKGLPSSANSTNAITSSSNADTYCANIFAITIDNGGTGYADPNFNIILHYSGYSTATLPVAVTGSVVYTAITSLTSNQSTLSSYIKSSGVLTYISAPKIPTNVKYITRATISISTTGTLNTLPMLLTPILTPIDLTTDLSSILPCWYVGFYAKFDPNSYSGVDFPDIITVNDYRQISLIKNPVSTISTGSTVADNVDNSMDCLRYFTMTNNDAQDQLNLSLKIYQCDNAGNLLGSTVSENAANVISAEAHLDYIKTFNSVTRVYFHQNYTGVNVKNFTTSETSENYIRFGGTPTAYRYTSIVEPEYKRGTGEVLFVENRGYITRNTNQAEEIKLIIQL